MAESTIQPKRGGYREGAGRKCAHEEGRTVPVSVTVPEVFVDGLDEIAEAQETTRSQVATEAIRRFLEGD